MNAMNLCTSYQCCGNRKISQNSRKLINHLSTSINQTLSAYVNSDSGCGPKAARQSMEYRSVGTNEYRTTVHLYPYLYLYLHVQCNTIAVTVAPLRKMGVKEVFSYSCPDLTLEVGVSTGALVESLKQTPLRRHNRQTVHTAD